MKKKEGICPPFFVTQKVIRIISCVIIIVNVRYLKSL